MITPAYSPTATERVLPRLALDFTTGSLDPRVTVARALNTATRVNSSGYVETINANLPRFDYDPVTLAPRGLLIEETRSNLLLYSSQFDNPVWIPGTSGAAVVTPDAAVSPDNATNADLLADNSTTEVSGRRQDVGITSGSGTYTVSCFIKKNTSNCASIRILLGGGTSVLAELAVDTATGAAQWRTGVAGTSFSVVPYGNGWFRVSATVTDNASGNVTLAVEFRAAFAATYSPTIDLTATGSIYIWGVQAEAGAFATSYIPTTTTSLTRNADQVTMTGTNFSSWWQATIGGVLVRARQSAITGIRPWVHISDGTADNIISLRGNAANPELYIKATTDQAQIDAGTLAVNTSYGLVGAWNTNDCAVAINGGAAVADTSATIPTVDRMLIGSDGTNYLSGWAEKISYWPQRITNAETQAFSK